MSEFQERLWSELVRDHAPALACPRGWQDSRRALPIIEDSRTIWPMLSRWRAMRLAAAGAVAIAAVIAVVLLTAGTSTSPPAAFAVKETPDGALHVTITELTTGVAGANAQLAKLRANARIVPVQPGCAASGTTVPTPLSLTGKLAHGERQGVALYPHLIPSGDTLVLAARQLGSAIVFSFALYRGPIPPCIAPGYNNVR